MSSFGNLFNDTGNSFNALDLTSMRLEFAPIRVADWIDKNMVDYAIRDILDPMKRLATSRKHAQRFIDALEIVKLAPLKIAFIINDLLKKLSVKNVECYTVNVSFFISSFELTISLSLKVSTSESRTLTRLESPGSSIVMPYRLSA